MIRRLLYASLGILLFLGARLPAHALLPKILVIHAYHQGYPWTDMVDKGIREGLGDRYEVDSFYMDTQRVSRETAFGAAEAGLEKKYGQANPDCVITVDDDALIFYIAHGRDLFPRSRLVFCGINNLDGYNLAELGAAAGVAEAPDVGGTIDSIRTLFPRTSTILALGDGTTSGKINLGLFEKAAERLPAGIEIIRTIAPEREELEKLIRSLPADSAVLYLSWLQTRAGVRYRVDESMAIVAAACDAAARDAAASQTAASQAAPTPVFGCWDFLVGPGAIGGRVVSGHLQGIVAAEQAKNVLKGIPVLEAKEAAQRTWEYRFDWEVLKKHRISPLFLPKGTVLIGYPKGLPAAANWGIFFLILVIVLEAGSIIVILRGKRALAAAESRYRTLTEHIPAVVYSISKGRPTSTAYINPRIQDLMGYSVQEWIGDEKLWIDTIHEDDRERIRTEMADMSAMPHMGDGGKEHLFEYRSYHKSGRLLNLRNQAVFTEPQKGVREVLGFINDATAEKEAEAVLKEALNEKQILLQEVHHRVKNNFQIVTSLLRLEGDQMANEEARNALQLAESRIHAMSLVHERLYMEGNFASIDVRSYLESLSGAIQIPPGDGGGHIVAIEGDEVQVPLEKAVPLGLYCNEALMNVAKHAFPADFRGQRKVTVRVRRADSRTVLEIVDTGVGFVSSKPETAEGLGFSLMSALADQLGGTHAIESGPQGTTIRLRFKAE